MLAINLSHPSPPTFLRLGPTVNKIYGDKLILACLIKIRTEGHLILDINYTITLEMSEELS